MSANVKGKDRLMLFTVRAAYITFYKGRQDQELFREFANACNLTKYTLSGISYHYAHPPQIQTVKKYFDDFLTKTDYENPLDRFRELHRKLCTKLSSFTKPGVECIRGLILYFSYECGLLRTYDELYEACRYMNENSQWRIQYSELPEIPEEKLMANLANEELMIYTIVCFAYQTYRVSIKFSGMEAAFNIFARELCKLGDKAYCYGPISINVPSFRTIRKTFEDYYPLYASRPGPERVIRAYKMIEKENKKGCKAAVHGLLLFLSYYNRLISTYEEVFEVALALTKYTRPAAVEGQEDVTVLANFDINDIIGSLQAEQACQMTSEDDVKPELDDIKLETDDVKLEMGDIKPELDDVKPNISKIQFPSIDFSEHPSSSGEHNPHAMNLMIKQEIDNGHGNNNRLIETIDLTADDDEPMDINPVTSNGGDIDLIQFLTNNAYMNYVPELGLHMNAENSIAQEVIDLTTEVDVKKEAEDYLSQFSATETNTTIEVVDVEDRDDQTQDDQEIEIIESEDGALNHGRVVAVDNLAPLDLSLFF